MVIVASVFFSYLYYIWIMIIEIKKPVTKEKVKEALIRFSKENKKKTLRKHFGELKRGLNGVAYQKKARNEWI